MLHESCSKRTALVGPAEAPLDHVAQSTLQEQRTRSAVHLTLEQFEAVHLPFDLTLRMSGQLYPMT